jgi:hypothetical protein
MNRGLLLLVRRRLSRLEMFVFGEAWCRVWKSELEEGPLMRVNRRPLRGRVLARNRVGTKSQ